VDYRKSKNIIDLYTVHRCLIYKTHWT